MTDLSFQGATLKLVGPNGVGSVTIRDLSDEGTPISFGRAQPVRTSKTMFGRMLAWHAQSKYEFTLSPIPGSETDKAIRALLASSVVTPNREVGDLADVCLTEAILTVPSKRGFGGVGGISSGGVYTYRTGFVTDGTQGIGSNGEGRKQGGPYTFEWEEWDPPADTSVGKKIA